MYQSIEYKAAAIVTRLAETLAFPADPMWKDAIADLIENDLRRFPGDEVEIEEAWRRGLAPGTRT